MTHFGKPDVVRLDVKRSGRAGEGRGEHGIALLLCRSQARFAAAASMTAVRGAATPCYYTLTDLTRRLMTLVRLGLLFVTMYTEQVERC